MCVAIRETKVVPFSRRPEVDCKVAPDGALWWSAQHHEFSWFCFASFSPETEVITVYENADVGHACWCFQWYTIASTKLLRKGGQSLTFMGICRSAGWVFACKGWPDVAVPTLP